MPELPTPKQPQNENRKDWYPYYAGFTESFVAATLEQHFSGSPELTLEWFWNYNCRRSRAMGSSALVLTLILQ